MVSRRAHTRTGGLVKGHWRNGIWIEKIHRSGSHVSESSEATQRREAAQLNRITANTTPLAYCTHCWWCGESVHFYRAEDGGCALFDMLGFPWPLHRCWELYRERIVSRMATELPVYRFDGRRYYQERSKVAKTPTQQTLTASGFVDRDAGTRVRAFLSWRGATAGEFREVRFVPESDPGVYYAVQVPGSVVDQFTAFSLHSIDAAWKKHGGRWVLFLEALKRLRAGGRAEKVVRGTVSTAADCFYCGSDIENLPWGFDTNFRVECRNCGKRRRTMTGDEYVSYIKRCFYRIRKGK